ncbi:thrombospondin-type laminin G domain and EAR repeat-containing protein-like [Ruditapes philippinarum]|uniref:thrombospondin-type laminin G domain and EAR repeat-containing protein-like n=1 Tax=Ruditapes philippinarum TaxID=129788 RepID=UPI00295AF722|nr:thrombospondin-type laminin G domain and EAR repeat-containing protein-like [Ruditapes philippinarum]
MRLEILIIVNTIIKGMALLKIPTACTNVGPINFIDEAMPRIGHLPEGVSVVYDVKSHVHALQFLPEMDEIKFPTTAIFKSCQYLPEEFSVFFILKHGQSYLKKECVFSISTPHRTYVSVCMTSKKIIFTYNNKKSKFRNAILTDSKWHTVGFSVTGSHVTMTTDCLHRRKHKLRRNFPSFLEIQNSVIRIAKCESCNSAFQGLLKDVIFVPGADVARRTCPPKTPRNAYMDNHIPTDPDTHISSYSSVGPDWAGCKWMDVGNLAFDVYSRSIKVCVNGIWKHVSTDMPVEKPAYRQLDFLQVHQDIITPSASIDIELFHMPGEGLFAVFANSNPVASRARGVSGLYKWTEKNFRLYQRLPSISAQCWRHFTIGENFYLAVANYGNDTSKLTNSTIFKWHRHRRKFREFQAIGTYTARDMEYFTIDNEHYLAIANHAIGPNQEVDSVILKWDRAARRFVDFQTITTTGAYDWTYFRVQEYHFLAIAQAFNGKTTLMDSLIYVFQKDKFLPFQTIETNGATDWEFFTIEDEAFLAVANAYNYGPQNFQNQDTYQTNSSIYKLDIGKRAFFKYQTFVTNSAIDWEHFMLGDDHYLVVSNAQNGGSEQERLTTIYRLQGVDKFVPVHNMYLEPSADWEVFEDDNDVYFVYSNAKGRKSQILKAKFRYI